MFGKDLEFAGDIPHDLRRDIIRLLPAEELLAAYRKGLMTYRSNDIVLVVAKHDPELIEAWPRGEYLQRAMRNNAAKLTARIAHESARQVARCPVDSEVFWLVIEDKSLQHPVMCVLFTTKYKTEAALA